MYYSQMNIMIVFKAKLIKSFKPVKVILFLDRNMEFVLLGHRH
jgi:hypothetical protein